MFIHHITKQTNIGLKGQMKEDEIRVIIRECLLGLAFLHGKSKIHRDIKCGIFEITRKYINDG